jgi:hypothetical protein
MSTRANDLVERLTDLGAVQEQFVYGIGRIENLGAVSRLVFYSPRISCDRTVNGIEFTLIVPTDQIPALAAALVRTRGEKLVAAAARRGGDDDEISVH